MPIGALLEAMDPPVPSEVLKAAESLRYRDFMTVALVVPEEYGFPDNWIYIHDPDVEVGRIQNFASWSPYLVKDGRTCLGLEFFVQEGDEMWTKSDDDLVERASAKPSTSGSSTSSKVETGYVVRMPKAYPFYDWEYKAHVGTLRRWLDANTPERLSGRAQRHAPLQQPGPLHVHGDAHRREHLRCAPRRLERQRRSRIPRRKGLIPPRVPCGALQPRDAVSRVPAGRLLRP